MDTRRLMVISEDRALLVYPDPDTGYNTVIVTYIDGVELTAGKPLVLDTEPNLVISSVTKLSQEDIIIFFESGKGVVVNIHGLDLKIKEII
ncbi:MAG: hypothetical protein P9L97_06105 [Candidatus Tenebribacter davisii]|nr:hypothetical protein [Candidatus Tenebribacter davisii]